jgi:hypothetical protein
MKQLIDLLNLPHIFSQQPLLTKGEFKDQYNRRMGLFGNEIFSNDQLEALHRVGLLRPMYRFQRRIDDVLAEMKRLNYPLVRILSILRSTPKQDFKNTQFGDVLDPRHETFVDWDRYKGSLEEHSYSTSHFLYSTYQLLLAPTISQAINTMTSEKKKDAKSSWDREFTVHANEAFSKKIDEEAKRNDELVLVLSALEPLYITKLKGHWYLEHYSGSDIDGLLQYQDSFDPIGMLEWIGWTAEQIKESARLLLLEANSIDSMKDWHELLQLCHPDKWAKLRGDALIAFDYRFAAEILLRFYEDLVKVNAAPPLELTPRRFSGPYDNRLNPDPGQLNKVLMDFGLSPEPSVVLILEGDTELSLVPKVMALLGVPQHQNFIRLFKAEGIRQDFGLMARLVAVPALGESISNMILLDRPPTNFFVVLDAEKHFSTLDARKRAREVWIDKIYQSIPDQYKGSIDKNQIGSLVVFETWKNTIFEYAHFTDRELAKAIISLYKGKKNLSLEETVVNISTLRKNRENIDKIWEKSGYISKVDLANYLWPILENKIVKSKNPLRIPIVRIVLKAGHVAGRTHRRNVGLQSVTNKKRK